MVYVLCKQIARGFVWLHLCREPSRLTLELAKHNVERFYPVVGVSERMPELIALLEYLLPAFFRGATKLYQEISQQLLFSSGRTLDKTCNKSWSPYGY